MREIHKAALLLVGVIGCHPGVGGGPAPAVAAPAVTVRQVLTTQALVGETVVVSGRCLGDATPAVAKGSRPFSGSVWQFEDNGVAVWVAGPKPAGCGSGSAPAAQITARVAQDSLPLFSQPRTTRQYLVVR
jgi:hypothetical protein